MTKSSRTGFLWFRSENRKSKIKTRKWLRTLAIACTFTLGAAAAQAQPPHKIARVAILALDQQRSNANDFFLELRRLGWIEGQNINFELRSAEGKVDHLPELAAELISLKPDVILASATPPALAVQKLTSSIPIVFTLVADPVGSGLVASLARPGANITGMTNLNNELSAKRLELLKEMFPKTRTVAILSNPADPISAPQLKDVEPTAHALGLHLRFIEARDPKDFEGVSRALAKTRSDALVVVTSQMFVGQGAKIIHMAAKNRLPSVFWTGALVEAGGLMSYGVNVPAVYRRAAFFVDRILKGTKPADLPVEQPTKFEFIINLKTAKQIGVTIPQSVLFRADKVIR
jgi:putative tryptophan/tyrosine transport system substrate-binding protein